jgi:hypothetical protein
MQEKEQQPINLLKLAIAQTKRDRINFSGGELVIPEGMNEPEYLTKEEFNNLTKINFKQVSDLIGTLIKQIEANRREIEMLKQIINQFQQINYN